MTSHYSINGLQQDYLYLFSISAYASWYAWTSIRKSIKKTWKLGRGKISHSSLRMDIWIYLLTFPVRFILLIPKHWVTEQLLSELLWCPPADFGVDFGNCFFFYIKCKHVIHLHYNKYIYIKCCWRKPEIISSLTPVQGLPLWFPELGPSSEKIKIFWNRDVDFFK